MPWCLRANVERTTPYFRAIREYENCSPGPRDSISAVALSIAAMVVEIKFVEIEAHGHGSLIALHHEQPLGLDYHRDF